MRVLTVQLNHTGVEKKHTYRNKFVEGRGYYKIENQLIREWNDESTHYRKYLRQSGTYVENLKTTQLKNDQLLFWGEWEGYSKYYPLKSGLAKGIHEPFHSIVGKGCQNTDPYVFGEYFKYAICSQKGIMTELDTNSLILFGTTTNDGFLLDTVFVVKEWEKADAVSKNKGVNYTQIYKEETLLQLGNLYLGKNPSQTNRLYHGRTWWDDENKDYFSYVPCKTGNYTKAEKVIIPFEKSDSKIKLSSQKVGHPYKNFLSNKVKDIWSYITDLVLQQGFVLGVKFNEPVTNDLLTENRTSNFDMKNNCSEQKGFS